jgi:CheY-like chemotaxis protein
MRARNLSVLCVYDNTLFLDRMCRNLEKSGDLIVEISVSAADALHLMTYILFDIIVTDGMLAPDDPNALLKAVRMQGRQIPFIYFTKFSNSLMEEDALHYGGVKFLVWGDAPDVPAFDKLIRLIHKLAEQNLPLK